MKAPFSSAVTTLILVAAISVTTLGQEGEETHHHDHDDAIAHTHIGINPTWRPADWNEPTKGAIDSDPTDNNKLWLFSMPPVHEAATPGWPAWEHANGNTFLVLTPVLEEGQRIAKPGDPNKTLFTCDFLYGKDEGYGDAHGAEHLEGWSTAFGPQAAWNLESIDANTLPAWDIYLRRERISGNLERDDFLLLLPNDTAALESDGDTYFLEKEWLDDENAWGVHAHAGFYFWLDEGDDEVAVVLSAHDAGGLYERSADFTIRFAKTVVQPITGDLNNDGVVDIADIEILIDRWGQSGVYSGEQVEADDHDHEN
jgi:hypothetical protein